jgi:hypothetical protein
MVERALKDYGRAGFVRSAASTIRMSCGYCGLPHPIAMFHRGVGWK